MSPYLRFTLTATGAVLVAGAAGWLPTVRSAGTEGPPALATAAALALAAALAGHLPVHRARRAPLERRAQAALLAVGVRLFATLAGLGILLSSGLRPVEGARDAFLTWVAVFYVVLLGVETWTIAASVRTVDPAEGAARPEVRDAGSGASA